jgi:hypothetical protein
MSLLFVSLNFIISAFSDIILNLLSYIDFSPNAIKALRPYFNKQSFIISALYAGLTVLSVLLITMMLSKALYDFYNPKTFIELLLFLALAIPLGFIADILIDKFKVFGSSLNEYYKIAGAGFWGAAAFAFSIIFSYLLQKLLTKNVNKK